MRVSRVIKWLSGGAGVWCLWSAVSCHLSVTGKWRFITSLTVTTKTHHLQEQRRRSRPHWNSEVQQEDAFLEPSVIKRFNKNLCSRCVAVTQVSFVCACGLRALCALWLSYAIGYLLNSHACHQRVNWFHRTYILLLLHVVVYQLLHAVWHLCLCSWKCIVWMGFPRSLCGGELPSSSSLTTFQYSIFTRASKEKVSIFPKFYWCNT